MGLVTIGNIIVTAPTQSQLNSKVEFDMKITLVHPTTTNIHPKELNVSNISAVTDMIFKKNFQDRVLGSTSTVTQQ